jgi:hypothetical protein
MLDQTSAACCVVSLLLIAIVNSICAVIGGEDEAATPVLTEERIFSPGCRGIHRPLADTGRNACAVIKGIYGPARLCCVFACDSDEDSIGRSIINALMHE